MKKLLVLSCLLLILFLSASSYILADNTSKKELFFGPVISGLEGTGVLNSKSSGDTASLSRASLNEGKQETIHFSLDIAQTSLNTIRSKDYVKIEGLKPYGNPGEPQLPFKSFVVTLPIGSEVSDVSVSGVSYRPILNKLDIVANPIPVAHTQNAKQTADTEKQIKSPTGKQIANGRQTASVSKSYSKCKTCDSENFLPGNLVSYITGRTNNTQLVFIKFFPFQYIPGSGRAILVTDAEITVNYQLTNTGRKTE